MANRDIQLITSKRNVTKTRYFASTMKVRSVTNLIGYDGNTDLYRFRANPVSTVPVDGKFVLPTNYHAYRFKSTYGRFDYWTPPSYGSVYRYQGESGSMWSGPGARYSVVGDDKVPIIPERVINRCRIKINNAIRYGDTGINLGQTLAEMGETVGFIASTMESVLRAYQAITRKNYQKAWEIFSGHNTKGKIEAAERLAPSNFRYYVRDRKRFINAAKAEFKRGGTAGVWLGVQYGWLPMLADIHGAATTLSEGLQNNPPLTVTRISKDTDFDGSDFPPYSSAWITEAKGSFNRGVEISATYSIRDAYLYDLTRLGLTNPLSTAWEVVPLSFVADWFIPIGSFLESLTPPIGLVFKHGYVTKFVKWHAHLTFWEKRKSHYYGIRKNCVQSLESFSRTVVGPGYFVVSPTWDPRLNTSKLISIAALSQVLFGQGR